RRSVGTIVLRKNQQPALAPVRKTPTPPPTTSQKHVFKHFLQMAQALLSCLSPELAPNKPPSIRPNA
ncbi:hypothetical protein, partial [Pseudomonas fluorescens]|uniref:hypothetical protein n=1 Tax=Pseudomonas fluorescens TaxID=294 RepID=UPI001C37613E